MRTNWHAAWLRLLPLGALALAACNDNTLAPKVSAPEKPSLVITTPIGSDPYQVGDIVHGAIFTTTYNGQIVNENVRYQAKTEVYLDGGPHAPKASAAGLPDGLYVFQITDPSGAVLLSMDPAVCRVVQVEGGVITNTVAAGAIPGLAGHNDTWDDKSSGPKCHIEEGPPDAAASTNARHDINTDVDHGTDAKAKTVQMWPFYDTPNPGGVYKAWMTPLKAYLTKRTGGVAILYQQTNPIQSTGPGKKVTIGFEPDPGFKNPARNFVKTDNFKVKENPPFIRITKLNDANRDGLAPGDAELPGWTVTVDETLPDGFGGGEYLTPTDKIGVPIGSTLKVCEVMQAGYRFSYAKVGDTYLYVGSGVTADADSYCVQVGPIASNTTVEIAFGNIKMQPKAKISIAPATATNEVGTQHKLTATVQIDRDAVNTPTWENALDGTAIAFKILSGPGSLNPTSCNTSGGTGACSVYLTAATAGTTVVEASSTPNVSGTPISVKTDGTAPNSGPAYKYWVDAYITIAPDGLNPVGVAHTFGVTFTAVPGAATPVTFNSITVGLSSATLVNPTDYWVVSETCSDKSKWGGSGNARTCQVVINANKAGSIKAHAAGSVTMGADQDLAGIGSTVLRETNGTAPNSGDAVKTYYVPQGCTPGFWQGGNGSQLWDATSLPDPDWVSRIGGSNPFRQIDAFNGYALGSGLSFSAASELNGMSMLDIVGTGGTAVNAQKTARDVIAAYLNRSAGLLYPYTLKDIVDSWNAANQASPESARQAALLTLHTQLDAANNLHNAPLCQ